MKNERQKAPAESTAEKRAAIVIRPLDKKETTSDGSGSGAT
ncbi:hypothetical protein OIE68_12075 [Nocardia vinacea]|uniref:Uncharacterized protein n=1 Tax=Nocardia vinacea TaxID=96468 RepID=A0ABZ1YVK9_9NOCA|nr:hypothetical protein OIE68_12075 [Nocardia vinacea]